MNNCNVGIVGYGAYVPRNYIKCEDLDLGARGLGLVKKSLAWWDEDSVTMAVEASQTALVVAGIVAGDLGAVYVGSESPPYAVNPMSTIVADVLGLTGNYRAVDLQFACKAATAGLQMVMGEVSSGHHDYGLVVGVDKAQARRGDVLEWSAGAAAAALVVGGKGVIARVLDSVSVTSDTPDFWRRVGQEYPEHGGRFTGEPAYFTHVIEAGRQLLERRQLKPGDLDYAVFHMPNGRFPVEAAKRLGFSPGQVEPFLAVKEVGNPYSASTLLGMAALLEKLKPNEKALVVAYGSGAGADALLIEGTEELEKRKWGGLERMLGQRKQVELVGYLQQERWL